MLTLVDTINYARSVTSGIPMTAWNGQNPAAQVASMVRSAILNVPFQWSWNRDTDTTLALTAGTQDYNWSTAPYAGFIERLVLQNGTTSAEISDIYNNKPLVSLAVGGTTSVPNSVSVFYRNFGAGALLRFLNAPDANYTTEIVYQNVALPFVPISISSVAAASSGTTAYTLSSTTDPNSLQMIYEGPTGGYNPMIQITGCTNGANNGLYPLSSIAFPTLTLSNPSGVLESSSNGTALNVDWNPIPDSFCDVYNALFVAEMFLVAGDEGASARYRQRGMAALLSKVQGLNETFTNQVLQQAIGKVDVQGQRIVAELNQGITARAI